MKNKRIKVIFLCSTSLIAWQTQASTVDVPDVEFYGSMRLGVDYIDAGAEDDGANGRDFLSRVGVVATTEIRPDLKRLGVIEYGIREENSVDITQNEGPTLRLAYIGATGKWGELYYGSQANLFHKYVRTSYFSDGLDSIRQGAVRDDGLLQYYYSNVRFFRKNLCLKLAI